MSPVYKMAQISELNFGEKPRLKKKSQQTCMMLVFSPKKGGHTRYKNTKESM